MDSKEKEAMREGFDLCIKEIINLRQIIRAVVTDNVRDSGTARAEQLIALTGNDRELKKALDRAILESN